jgi:hypothetical protein
MASLIVPGINSYLSSLFAIIWSLRRSSAVTNGPSAENGNVHGIIMNAGKGGFYFGN